MDVTIDLHRLVHNYAGGARELATRIGMPYFQLLHKVDPENRKTQLGPDEMLRAMLRSKDFGPLQIMATACRFVCLPMPADQADGDANMQMLAKTVREFGEFATELASDMADGAITGNELKRIRAEGLEALAAIQQVLAHVEALHEAGRPRRADRAAAPGLGVVEGGRP